MCIRDSKICILASLAFGKHVYPEQIHTEGIGNITLDDVKLVVPLRMPAISYTSLAARHWSMGRRIGMPPPTLASKDVYKRQPH